jgi:two-component system NtrC family sensor kinase
MQVVSLRWKISLILVMVVTLYAALDYGIQRLIIFPSFVELENREAKKDLDRCFEAIRRETYHLDTFNHDWAAWDDTYQFVQDGNTEYATSNLVAQTFVDNGIHLIYVCDTTGKVVWGEIRDIETWKKICLEQFPPLFLPPTHPLLSHDSIDSLLAGVFSTESGPMLVSSRPIVTSTNTGPIQGTLIMGRFLNPDSVETLARQTRVDFQLWPIGGDGMPEQERQILRKVSVDEPLLVDGHEKDTLHIYSIYPDVSGRPALLVRADVAKEISARGRGALQFALLSILAAGMVVLALLFWLLKRTVVGPVEKLTEHVAGIGKSDDLYARLSLNRSDEIGTLAREFDRMVEQLQEARNRLLEQSYQAGMVEMASGILHNIRNTLNPMIVDIDGMRQDLRNAPIEKMALAARELAEGNPSSARRDDLVKFMELGNRELSALIQDTGGRLEEILKRAGHIEEILPDRDRLTQWKQSLEPVSLDKLLGDAVALIPGDLRNVSSVTIAPTVAQVERIHTHRISLLHVVSNLLINAAESIRRAGSLSGKVDIRARLEEVNSVQLLHLEICDNGEGIDSADLDRIFERGFTTKQEGSAGIGLHWCANTIAAMNGRLYAESEGPGYGACFHLMLPVNP